MSQNHKSELDQTCDFNVLLGVGLLLFWDISSSPCYHHLESLYICLFVFVLLQYTFGKGRSSPLVGLLLLHRQKLTWKHHPWGPHKTIIPGKPVASKLTHLPQPQNLCTMGKNRICLHIPWKMKNWGLGPGPVIARPSCHLFSSLPFSGN